MSEEVEGRVTISRTNSSHTDDYITMKIRYDEVEVEAVLSLEDFALAITGLGRVPAQIRTWPAPRMVAK